MASRTLTGAWIETLSLSCLSMYGSVAPSRVRGLKPDPPITTEAVPDSRTLTGAWIETIFVGVRPQVCICRTLTGAWIETLQRPRDH